MKTYLLPRQSSWLLQLLPRPKSCALIMVDVWETGKKIILVAPSTTEGQVVTSHRNNKKQKVRIERIHWD